MRTLLRLPGQKWVDRGRVFLRWSTVYGLTALGMLGIFGLMDSDIGELGWGVLCAMAVLAAVLGGAWTALCQPPAPPAHDKETNPQDFVVAFQPWLRTYTWWVWFPFFGVAVLGTFLVTGIDSKSGLILLIWGPVWLSMGVGFLTFQIVVSGNQVQIRRWHGTHHLRLEQVIDFERQSWWYWLFKILPGWPYRLCWVEDSDQTRQIILPLDMDRLQNAKSLESVLALSAESAKNQQSYGTAE